MAKILFVAFIIWQIVKVIRKGLAPTKRTLPGQPNIRIVETRSQTVADDPQDDFNSTTESFAQTPASFQGQYKEASDKYQGSSDAYTDTSDRYTDVSDRWSDQASINSFPATTDSQGSTSENAGYQRFTAKKRQFKSASISSLRSLPPPIDAYALETSAVRRTISLDKESLRTFVLTREILGPPRSRSRFRPGARK